MSDLERESNSESGVENQESRSSRKRKAYSVEKKPEAVDYASKYSKHSAAKKFNISRCMVWKWVNKEQELREHSRRDQSK